MPGLTDDYVRPLRPDHPTSAAQAARTVNGGSQLDDLDAAACRHLADPETVVMPGLMFLAWGRKSAAG